MGSWIVEARFDPLSGGMSAQGSQAEIQTKTLPIRPHRRGGGRACGIHAIPAVSVPVPTPCRFQQFWLLPIQLSL
jgi:hypothetical protein